MTDNRKTTEILKADNRGLQRAATILKRGGLVAVPTETVYGLAARADRAESVAAIYAAKSRPNFNPLIVHVENVKTACKYGVFNEQALCVSKEYWPGPLTLVLPLLAGANLAPEVTAGLPTVALRAPAHPVMRKLLAQTACPIAAPSANRSGFVSPTSAEHVLNTLEGRIDAVVDGGRCVAGLESTIIAVRQDGSLEQLRPGPIEVPDALTQRGNLTGGNIESPGQLASHYAPGKPVRLNAVEAQADEFLIGLGAISGDCSLSETGDLEVAANNLYDCLHQAAASQKPRVAVAPIPEEGIGQAINDRLRRAATPIV